MSARRQPRVSLGKSNLSSPDKHSVDPFELFHGTRGALNNPKLAFDANIPPSPRTPQGGLSTPNLPPISPRNTRSGANPHYPISMTRHMVQEDAKGAGYISPRDQFSGETYLEQQKKDKYLKLALADYHAVRKAQAEKDIISGREEAERAREYKELKRIEAKKAQREAHENRVYGIAEKERRKARNWM